MACIIVTLAPLGSHKGELTHYQMPAGWGSVAEKEALRRLAQDDRLLDEQEPFASIVSDAVQEGRKVL